MSDFAKSWNLSRGRFVEAVSGLNQEQLNWRLHPGTLTIGEMVLHVVGVETWFISQIVGRTIEGEEARLVKAAVDGVVNDLPFPYSPDEITPEAIAKAFAHSKALVEPHMDNPSAEFLAKELKSALGPMITGEGALARMAFHPGYHHGQAYLMITAPGFPA